MCMFCAGIPAVMAIGTKVNHLENVNQRKSHLDETENARRKLPVKSLTLLAVLGLILASVTYHTQLGPQ